MKDFLDGFQWHSSIGINDETFNSKKYLDKIANTEANCKMFDILAGNDLLIHKSTQALWKISEDKKSIEPVFSSDILTEDDLSGEK